jgi:protein ImuB
MFAAVHIPEFSVQAVLRQEPELSGRAVALIEGTPPLVHVVAMSEAARRAGVRLGMPKSTAAQFAGLEIRTRSQAFERSAHAALLDLGWSISPRIEDSAADLIVADVQGLETLLGDAGAIARQFLMRGKACGLSLNVAIAETIEAAVVAARGFPGIRVIPAGEEAAQLSSLPVSVLALSPENAATLERWGIRTCGALAALPVLELSERLGREGVRLHALAQGAGTRTLVVAEAARTFLEEMQLDDAVEELEPLSFLLGRLLDQLCARLAARALAASVLRLRFELEPAFEKAVEAGKEIVRQKQTPGLYIRDLQLPVPMRDSKTLLKLLRLRLQSSPPRAPITKIWMAAEAARPRTVQNALFFSSYADVEKLELTLMRLANIVGEQNAGSPVLLDSHRPDAFCMTAFSPRQESAVSVQQEPPAAAKPSQCCRIFRPPLPARVELSQQHPARVFFQGLSGKVVTAAGPWKSSGDWWRKEAWQYEEWDLELVFSSRHFTDPLSNRPSPDRPSLGRAVFRVVYDARAMAWFIRGIYD